MGDDYTCVAGPYFVKWALQNCVLDAGWPGWTTADENNLTCTYSWWDKLRHGMMIRARLFPLDNFLNMQGFCGVSETPLEVIPTSQTGSYRMAVDQIWTQRWLAAKTEIDDEQDFAIEYEFFLQECDDLTRLHPEMPKKEIQATAKVNAALLASIARDEGKEIVSNQTVIDLAMKIEARRKAVMAEIKPIAQSWKDAYIAAGEKRRRDKERKAKEEQDAESFKESNRRILASGFLN